MQQIAPKEYDYKEFQNIAKDKGPDEENKDPNEENPQDIVKELMSSEEFHEHIVQIAQKAFRNGWNLLLVMPPNLNLKKLTLVASWIPSWKLSNRSLKLNSKENSRS